MHVKRCTNELINLNDIEEQVLMQMDKIDWIRLRDWNNSYLYATLKSKKKSTNMRNLCKADGTILATKEDIKGEVLEFYGKLMGNAKLHMEDIDIVAMRDGKQLIMDQRSMLIGPISIQKIKTALKSIINVKAPGVDGFGSKKFKKSWSIIKHDVTAAVMDFFNRGKMKKKINSTFVTLIPKHSKAKTIRDYRPIFCCNTVYKITSKAMAAIMSKVLSSIISRSQATFEYSKGI